jgi:hypothetical protein
MTMPDRVPEMPTIEVKQEMMNATSGGSCSLVGTPEAGNVREASIRGILREKPQSRLAIPLRTPGNASWRAYPLCCRSAAITT